ncbi:MAG: UDP-N-acetylglucosamine 2-epimerase [Magnetococcus sp. DMHC-8]
MNVTIVTTGRADYGLLYPLIKELNASDCFDLNVVATGTHLSPLHGNTISHIQQDGFQVSPVEMTAHGDSEDAICHAIATGLVGFSSVFQKSPPDLIIVLGDRYELWAICMAAVIHKIPIAHLHGGESTSGAIDESIRHSVTKMSTFHFASIPAYAQTIIQMGENPDRVHVVGALGIDNIKNMPLMNIEEMAEYTSIDFTRNNVALMTYHPVTLDEYASAQHQIQVILEVLVQRDLLILVTMPNADTGNNKIHETIEIYCQKHPEKFLLIKNLGQRAYLSAMKYAKVMIGNSSSGIIESASFQLPVVNIGDRQGGRFKPSNVIDCQCSPESITAALDKALSVDFHHAIAGIDNPYGDGNSAKRIVQLLESIDLSDKTRLVKKEFHHRP